MRAAELSVTEFTTANPIDALQIGMNIYDEINSITAEKNKNPADATLPVNEFALEKNMAEKSGVIDVTNVETDDANPSIATDVSISEFIIYIPMTAHEIIEIPDSLFGHKSFAAEESISIPSKVESDTAAGESAEAISLKISLKIKSNPRVSVSTVPLLFISSGKRSMTDGGIASVKSAPFTFIVQSSKIHIIGMIK